MRTRILPLVLAAGFILAGCDDGTTVRVEFRVNLGVSSAAGGTFTFTFTNEGASAVGPASERFEFLVRDASGAELRRVADPANASRLAPGDSLSAGWDKRDSSGMLVPAGDYTVSISYRAGSELRYRTARFSL